MRSAICLVAGQELDGAVEQTRLLQVPHEARLPVEQRHAQRARQRQHLRLEVVVGQHQRRHVVGHLRQQRVALLLGHLAVGHGQAEQDLDVDLVVGGVDAGRVVDGVGVDAHPGQRRLDAAELRAAQVAAFGHHLAAQLGAVDAQRVVGAVADLGMAFAARLDVGADAAVVEQVHRRLQDGAEQLGRRHPSRRPASMPSAARACGDTGIDFSARDQTPPPAEIRLAS